MSGNQLPKSAALSVRTILMLGTPQQQDLIAVLVNAHLDSVRVLNIIDSPSSHMAKVKAEESLMWALKSVADELPLDVLQLTLITPNVNKEI